MELAPLTGIFGANSSGKTSLLQLLLLLKQTAESADRAQVLKLGNERSLVSFGTFDELLHRDEATNTLAWRLAWDAAKPLVVKHHSGQSAIVFKGRDFGFRAAVEKTDTGRVFLRRMVYEFANDEFSLTARGKRPTKYVLGAEAIGFRFSPSKDRPSHLPAPTKCYGFPDEVRSCYHNAAFLSDLELAFEDLMKSIHYLGPLREAPKRFYTWSGGQPVDMGGKGERVVEALLWGRESAQEVSRGRGKNSLLVEEYVADWLRKLGLVYSFSIEPLVPGGSQYRVLVRKNESSAEVPLPEVGFGVSQILPVITLCYSVPEGSIVILEQPEIHLHPAVQAGLADVLMDAISVRGIQVILESHSEHLLRRIQRRVAEAKFSDAGAALCFCEMSGSESKLTKLAVDIFGNIENWPEEFFGDEFGEMTAMTEAALKRRERLTS